MNDSMPARSLQLNLKDLDKAAEFSPKHPSPHPKKHRSIFYHFCWTTLYIVMQCHAVTALFDQMCHTGRSK